MLDIATAKDFSFSILLLFIFKYLLLVPILVDSIISSFIYTMTITSISYSSYLVFLIFILFIAFQISNFTFFRLLYFLISELLLALNIQYIQDGKLTRPTITISVIWRTTKKFKLTKLLSTEQENVFLRDDLKDQAPTTENKD